MDPREMFEGVLADFARETGRDLRLDARGGCTFFVADMPFNLQLLPASGQILAWSLMGRLGDDANAPRRARALLELNDAWEGSCGGTFMMDPDTGIVALADRRGVETICDADRLAAWIDSLVNGLVTAFRVTEIDFPYVDDASFGEVPPMIREVVEGKEPL